jgi:anti-anti-sigma factor
VSQLVDVRIEERGDLVIAHVSGELDLASSPTAGEAIGGAVTRETRALVVDCSELAFIDSSGVAMLFKLSRRLGSRRQQLRVVAPSGAAVARVLELVDFPRAAPVDGELSLALAELGEDTA